jgi:hypothetical protein
MSFRHVRAVLSEELAAIRKHEPDLDAGHSTVFSIPLLLGLVGVLAIGVVPLIVVRSGDETDSVLVPLAGSFALTAICTAVVAWLTANVLSGVIVTVLYRTSPRTSSQLVVRTMVESFYGSKTSLDASRCSPSWPGCCRWRSDCRTDKARIAPTACSTICLQPSWRVWS